MVKMVIEINLPPSFYQGTASSDTRGSQQPLRLNRNAERRQRRRARRQQTEVTVTAHVARVNVSHETREANENEGPSRHTSPLQIPQLQVTGGSPTTRGAQPKC